MTGRLLTKFLQQRGERLFLENLELHDTEIQGDQQFVFQGQCMVLGDSGAGKTSLVKSLTGKPFDSEQPKTQGIDQSLVNDKWETFDLKDLLFGDLWRFLNDGTVKVFLIETGAPTSYVLLRIFFLSKTPFWFELILIMFMCLSAVFLSMVKLFFIQEDCTHLRARVFLVLVPYMSMLNFLHFASDYAFHFTRNKFNRLVIATLSFILVGRVVFLASNLALMICCWDEKYAELTNTPAFLLLLTLTGIGLVAMFCSIAPIPALSSRNDYHHHRYQYHFLLNKLTLKTVIFFRLLLSMSLGVTIGLVVASLGKDALKEFYMNDSLMLNLTHFLSWNFPVECMRPTISLLFSMTDDHSWGPYAVLVAVFYYHLRLGLSSPSLYFALLFPPLACYTLYEEFFYFQIEIPENIETPNNLITLVTRTEDITDNKMLKCALSAKFSPLKLNILDFAGDKEYYAYHHMFLRRDAMYIIVFNIADFLKNDFSDITENIRRLQFWLESICSHISREVPIFLVGSHRGTMNNKYMKILDGHLRGSLWISHCDDLVMNEFENLIFFPVENSKGQHDIGVQRLQNKIESVAEQHKSILGRHIPLTWIRVQDAIINLKKKETILCITLKELPRAFDDFVCRCPNEMLEYFHEKGLVMYLKNSQDPDLSWVLLKPEKLVDIIIQLVTPPPENTQQRGTRHDWNHLQTKGMLSESLLTRIISNVKENIHIEAMTAFLEEYDLICPLVNKEVPISCPKACEPTHFVPSLLPMSADGNVPVWHDNDTDKEFYVFFNRFLPDPLFHRLLSRAHKNSKVEFPNGQTVLYRDAGKFFMNAWTPYRLKLMKEQKMIDVTFNYSHYNAMKPSDMLCQVFSMIHGICTRHFPFVSFHCGPACPSLTCPGHQDDYLMLSSPAEVDQGTRRCHVYNVMPGRQGDRIAFLYCENNNFDIELDEWIP